MANVYIKYAPNVFVAVCDECHNKGDIITMDTKYSQHDVVIFNFIGRNINGKYVYSVVREDGFNYQEFCKRKAERRLAWANASNEKSNSYYEASNEGKEFLSLAEPIKVGHHSESRHRALIERNHNRMSKSVEFANKSDYHASKADYWLSRANDINLSMPESIEFYEHELEQAIAKQTGLKTGTIPREHSYSLTYATKAVKDLTKKVEIARKLWG